MNKNEQLESIFNKKKLRNAFISKLTRAFYKNERGIIT
jgi:hypothetical protein